MKKDWINKTLRDFISLGGIPFFLLVLLRVVILDNISYLLEFILAGVLFLILFFIFRPNYYSGLSLIVVFFLSIYYDDFRFTIFGIIAYFLLLASLFFLKEDKKKVLIGAFLGLICSGISYVVISNFFSI